MEGLTNKDRYKHYLEMQFRTIAPTQAAMEFRKSTLKQLLAREQELRIKGIVDDELIFNMVIEELGDFEQTLQEFANKQVKAESTKRKAIVGSVIAATVALLLTITYILVGVISHVWHPTWLILVGGILGGVCVLLTLWAIACAKRKRPLGTRACTAAIVTIASVIVFLVLQLVVKLQLSYLTFLAMVAAILGVDTALAFFSNSKLKWIELPIFIEVFFVMLYVILGLALAPLNLWHPGWLMCLIGVVFAAVEGLVFVLLRSKKDKDEQQTKLDRKHKKENEAYWTQWDD